MANRPKAMSKTAPMPQTVQTATDNPPATKGTHSRAACMVGKSEEMNKFKLLAYSEGTQGASQPGTCRASIAPAPPAKVPAFATVQAAIEWNAQAASDQRIKRPTTTNQLSA